MWIDDQSQVNGKIYRFCRIEGDQLVFDGDDRYLMSDNTYITVHGNDLIIQEDDNTIVIKMSERDLAKAIEMD